MLFLVLSRYFELSEGSCQSQKQSNKQNNQSDVEICEVCVRYVFQSVEIQAKAQSEKTTKYGIFTAVAIAILWEIRRPDWESVDSVFLWWAALYPGNLVDRRTSPYPQPKRSTSQFLIYVQNCYLWGWFWIFWGKNWLSNHCMLWQPWSNLPSSQHQDKSQNKAHQHALPFHLQVHGGQRVENSVFEISG